MSNRVYNILFHTHTVSGIVISVLLYVIFFAGSFSFFRDEIVNWERNHAVANTEDIRMDYDAAMVSLDEKYDLHGRDISISKYYIERRVGVSLGPSKDSLASEKAKESHFFYLDTETLETARYEESYTLGEFLYRLHFFAKIPYPAGYYLSGFTAFFFLFAILTGIIVHWNKIVSNFYVFRPWAKLKTLWTDAHTAPGTIGLPFQFVYAVTGAFFMIKAVLVVPSVFVLYDGDQGKMYDELGYGEPSFEFKYQSLEKPFTINELVAKTRSEWSDFDINHLHIFNYGDENMHVSVEGATNRNTKFTGPGKMVFRASTGEVVSQVDPFLKTSYLEGVKNSLYRLHFGDYGGYGLRIVSFGLGLLSCFVILSGVMIWLVARNKNNVPDKKRRFNERVVNIYLAICLGMYPVTALSFIAVKIFQPEGMSFLYSFYFIGWLLIAAFFTWKRENTFTTQYSLCSGGALGLLIPLINGIVTGNWFWLTFLNQQFGLFLVDSLWIGAGVVSLFAVRQINKNKRRKWVDQNGRSAGEELRKIRKKKQAVVSEV